MNGANGVQGSLMRAMRGPILLITVGTLFAIDHVGPYAFSTTWPALLIVIGVMKLLERATASAS
ncbi:MAG: hypothetical protein JNK48_16425 [Bryobacterales bacterium]|nr:hypothetical protein [Bryobacterales bacterium]